MHEVKKVSVILPTYNERDNIVPLVEAIHSAVSQPHEIIVVDDNSPDGTSDVIAHLIDSGRVPDLKLKTRMRDRGLTKSIWEGIEMSKGDTIVWMDCDFSMPPEDIPRLLAKIQEGYDIAVGSRFVKGGKAKEGVRAGARARDGSKRESLIAIALSKILNLTLGVLLAFRFRDWTSGFIAARRDVFTKIKLHGDYGEYFMDLMFRAMLLQYSFIEIPYVCAPRAAGESKTAPNLKTLLKRGVKYLAMIVRLEYVRVKKWLRLSITDSEAL